MTSLTISNAVDAVIMRPAGSTGRPSLSLDFLADPTTAVSRLTFTRASSATRFNASGLLETVGNNVARLDFDPVTLAPRGLLIEEARTNNVVYSQTFTNAAWAAPTNATVTDNAALASDGTSTAATLIENSVTGLHALDSPGFSFVAGTTYTISLFVKAIGARDVELGFPVTVFTSRFASFNLQTGAVRSTDAGVTATIEPWRGGIYRISASATCASSAGSRWGTFVNNQAGTRSYTGDGSSGLQIWGAQLEVGAFPTSYIPTTTAAATRAADVATIATSAFPFNSVAGSFVLRTAPLSVTGTQPAITIDDGTANERYRIANDAGTWKAQVTDGGVTQADISVGSAVANTAANLGFAYAANDIAAVLNGGTVGTGTSATLPTVSTVTFGTGRHQNLTYYPRRMPDTELQGKTA